MPSIYPVVNAIDATLARVPAEHERIEVCLGWPIYKLMLAVKGMDTDPRQIEAWGHKWTNHPIPSYRGYPIRFDKHGQSTVMVHKANGSIISYQIHHPDDAQ